MLYCLAPNLICEASTVVRVECFREHLSLFLRLTFLRRVRFDRPRVGIGIHSSSLPQTHSSAEGEGGTHGFADLLCGGGMQNAELMSTSRLQQAHNRKVARSKLAPATETISTSHEPAQNRIRLHLAANLRRTLGCADSLGNSSGQFVRPLRSDQHFLAVL